MENKILMYENAEEENSDYNKFDQLYDECLKYLQNATKFNKANGDYELVDQDNNEELIPNGGPNYKALKNVSQDPIYENSDDFKKPESQIEEINIANKNKQETSLIIDSDVIKVESEDSESPVYDTIKENDQEVIERSESFTYDEPQSKFKVENELQISSDGDVFNETKSDRLRRLSEQLPKIIITQSNTSLSKIDEAKGACKSVPIFDVNKKNNVMSKIDNGIRCQYRHRSPYADYPKRLVSKHGAENVALISNVPFGKLRQLNDTFHTLINLRWRWIVTGTVVVHFAIWLVFAVFWYLASLAHYDFEPDPPQKPCITGGKDFVTIFLASVEAQTTIGFGDRTIDEECPESIFLFVMQLILGTGLSGILTCVVYAKLTRPEKLSRVGVGFSKKAAICMRDGQLCLMLRAWDLNYDHIISSDFSAHFVKTYRTKEGEVIRYYATRLELQHKQFLLWPVTVVHVIDETSPLYGMTPEDFMNYSYEITVSLKGASASMGTFTQSQTSYLPREVLWGYRFPSIVKFDSRKRMYVIDRKKLHFVEQVDTPLCSAKQLNSSTNDREDTISWCPGTPGSFSDKISAFQLERSSSFRRGHESKA